MTCFNGFTAALIMASTITYIVKYGVGNWKNRHRIGAVLIIVFAAAFFIFHLYSFF